MQRWSQLFIPTLREAPADAEVASHKLLLRAGYVRQLGAGLYSFLPLGQRALNKIVRIVREEMDRIGQEFHLPALTPAEPWQESGRYTAMGDNMFRLSDRKGAPLVLAMTHEEIMTTIARNELRSYKQLPQIWYQIQTKFRDEPRPKSGLLRVRQFLMKDSYSFDLDESGLDESYRKHDEVYRRIFTRCGLPFLAVDADSGAMGGSQSQEFMVYTEAGEDLIASSTSGYAANLEKATSALEPVEDLAPTSDQPELIHTPGARTIDEVGAYLNQHYSFELSSPSHTSSPSDLSSRSAEEGSAFLRPHHQIKTMAMIVTIRDEYNTELPLVVLLRGDHELNEAKLALTMPAFLATPKSPIDAKELREIRMMTPQEIELVFGSPSGYLGPTGIDSTFDINSFWGHPELGKASKKAVVILDRALEGRTNLVTGANKEDYHYRNVTPGRDFTPTIIADIRNINEGELDPVGREPLRLGKAVEIGHIFKLGRKYTDSMHARVLDRDGKEVTPIMGSYGIGIERILTAAVESSAAQFVAANIDPKQTDPQYALPPSIAPFEVVVTITNTRDAALNQAGLDLAEALSAAGVDTLLDDRDERAGVKFKDADLIGIPYRVNIGKKLAEGKLEFVDRLEGTTLDIPVESAAAHIANRITASKQ